MVRRLRFRGTDSKNGGCPAVHELDTGDIVVQGPQLTAPEELRQLQHFSASDVAVVVPRELLVHHGPKEVEHVAKPIDLDEFGQLFETFEYSAWRLESRRGYASDREDPDFEEFLKTGQVTYDLDSEWCTNMRRQTGAGKRVGRVRIVDDPPTEGQLFLLAYAECNAVTGEDIRNLPRAEAERLHLPEADFWVFDSRLVALLNFDEADILLNAEVITEPAEVNRYMQAFDAAMHHATPYRRFAAQMKR
ncbi:DUF6879 family protein [Streptomyces synnematoformans]|uniref:DUF6879 domain-containing protein n=1 Tax=Streptomyces synnematoformans TaxID=415721 RepID=A0ABN2YZ11_9ACTN